MTTERQDRETRLDRMVQIAESLWRQLLWSYFMNAVLVIALIVEVARRG